MPFVAQTDDGRTVAAAKANVDDEYRCRTCGEPLSIRRAHRREGEFVHTHFVHPGNDAGCSSGESETHQRMKALAYVATQEKWPDADVEYETKIDHPWAGTCDRRPDVLVTLPKWNRLQGYGVAIECQYRHESKDRTPVFIDYLSAKHSVIWLEEEHFGPSSVDLFDGYVEWWAEGDWELSFRKALRERGR